MTPLTWDGRVMKGPSMESSITSSTSFQARAGIKTKRMEDRILCISVLRQSSPKSLQEKNDAQRREVQ